MNSTAWERAEAIKKAEDKRKKIKKPPFRKDK